MESGQGEGEVVDLPDGALAQTEARTGDPRKGAEVWRRSRGTLERGVELLVGGAMFIVEN